MKKLKEKSPLKLDISIGPFIPEGHSRLNVLTSRYPWPYKDNSVEEIYSAFIFCRIPGKSRGQFMDEAYRVLVPGGKMTVISPYWSSHRAIQDYTHEWPPVVEQSFDIFNKDFRKTNGLIDPPYPQVCDFNYTGGYIFEQEASLRNDETRSNWVKRNLNAVNDLQIVLTKK